MTSFCLSFCFWTRLREYLDLRRREISSLEGLSMGGLVLREEEREYLLPRSGSISYLLMKAFNKRLYLFALKRSIINMPFLLLHYN